MERKPGLDVFSDADFGKENASQISIDGYVFMCSGDEVWWWLRNQSVIAHRSKETEFIAFAGCVQEAL